MRFSFIILSLLRFSPGEDVAWIIADGDGIVREHYTCEYPEDYMHHLHSVTKSVTSLLVGIACEHRIIPPPDTPLHSLFPRYSMCFQDSLKRQITLGNILAMNSGLRWAGGIGGDDLLSMTGSPDWVQYVLSRSMASPPGEVFNYNSGGTHLLSHLIFESCGAPTDSFAGSYLFEPLGVTEWFWDFIPAPDGTPCGAWGLHMKLRDMASLGVLVLNRGTADGCRIVSEEWLEESFSVHSPRPSCMADYGWQWWLPRNFSTETVCARGWYGDHSAFIFIFRELGFVLATAGGRPESVEVQALVDSLKLEVDSAVENHPSMTGEEVILWEEH